MIRTTDCVPTLSVALLAGIGHAQEPATKPTPVMRAAPMAPMSGGQGQGSSATPTPVLQAGAGAPDFVSQDAAGRDVRLSDYKDKVVVLDFWATWCQPCQKAMPHVQEIAKQFASQGVVALAVCTSDTRAKFDEWVAKNAATYPNVVFTCDLHDRGSDTFDERASSKLFHVAGLPTKLVIGKDRKVAATIVGFEDDDLRLEAGLARAGLAIDADAAKKGEAQITKAAAEEAARARAAIANPPPLFQVRLGKLKSGDALPDLVLRTAEGKDQKLSELGKKPVVLFFCWPDLLQRRSVDELLKRYSAYEVQTLVTFTNTSPEEFTKWVDANAGKTALQAVCDPAGKYVPSGDKPDAKEQMSFHARTLLAQITGGPQYGTPAFPFLLVADAQGHYVGHCNMGPRVGDALGNMLLNAGVKLSEADMPKVVSKPADFVAAPQPPAEPHVAPIQVGASAPDFEMQELDGKPLKLSDYKGKVVVLDFWATWCGPCKEAMPHVQKLAAEYKEQGVVVIASCTSDERTKFEAWVRENGVRYPNVVFAHDAKERTAERASHKLYGVSGIPAQYVIAREGKIAAFVSGYKQGEVLLDAALTKAGIKVDAETLAKAAEDQKHRDESKR